MTPRKSLYARLPEIYKIKDAEQSPPRQLEAFLSVLDEVLSGMRDNIEARYHDHFIESCADWVVPYIGDLLGASHLAGDPWTLRADVARTVFHRRRKGTLSSLESLVYGLSRWASQAVPLRERLHWTQHLNHQRPDAGGTPPLTLRSDLGAAVRGGTITLRDPVRLSFLGGPFDPFAHSVDVKPVRTGPVRYNVANVGVFVWRLAPYRVPVSTPGFVESAEVTGSGAGEAAALVRCALHPQADPVVLFNTHRFHADDDPPELGLPDHVPGPMPSPRLTTDAPDANPEAYVAIDHYTGASPGDPGSDGVGLILHVPDAVAPPSPTSWSFRGADLCCWEAGLRTPLLENEAVVDPKLGRVLFGVSDKAGEADPLAAGLFASYTYGFSGPTGAHPLPRPQAPAFWDDQPTTIKTIDRSSGTNPLEDALDSLQDAPGKVIIEIQDSATYRLDLSQVSDVEDSGGVFSLRLSHSLWIRAAAHQRPVIKLHQPLRFRAHDVLDAGLGEPPDQIDVVLEGLYVTWERGAPAFTSPSTGLIARVAINRLIARECTLDPGGAYADDKCERLRQDERKAFQLAKGHEFADPTEAAAFDQLPSLEIERSICGAVAADDDFSLSVKDSIVDGRAGVFDAVAPAVGAETDPGTSYGPPLSVRGATFFGSVRVVSVDGQGGIFIHPLEANDNQRGCVHFSTFTPNGNRLPPHHACVFRDDAALSFKSEVFGQAGYAQLELRSDRLIREQGPGCDQMGAFGYLKNTHKWKNISIRFREFMPVGCRPVLIPVT